MASQGPSGQDDSAASFIGALISLTSHSNMRYQGVLSNIDAAQATLALEKVRSWGTEGRCAAAGRPQDEVPKSEKVYDNIVFRAADVVDLRIDDPSPDKTERSVPPGQPAAAPAAPDASPPAQPQPALGGPPGAQPHAPYGAHMGPYGQMYPPPGMYGAPEGYPYGAYMPPPPPHAFMGMPPHMMPDGAPFHGQPMPGMPYPPGFPGPPDMPHMPMPPAERASVPAAAPEEPVLSEHRKAGSGRASANREPTTRIDDVQDSLASLQVQDTSQRAKKAQPQAQRPQAQQPQRAPAQQPAKPHAQPQKAPAHPSLKPQALGEVQQPPAHPQRQPAESGAQPTQPPAQERQRPVVPGAAPSAVAAHKDASVPTNDFDFEGANARFQRDAESAGTPSAATADQLSAIPPAPAGNFYDRKAGFFDNISSEVKDRYEKRSSVPAGEPAPGGFRTRQADEQAKNVLTFGDNAANYRGNQRRGRGGGRGRSRGRRGRGNQGGGERPEWA
ncbi:hypothetical protein MSPP1_001584 [Malassezia sp. CBS 17886]|nr:hypothetical protein MSPP1_001584 [Malassezia sp. CBS 17886]